MTTYPTLTKKIKDKDGNDIVVCKYYGTEQCRNIHKLNECTHTCPVIGVMLEALNAYEETALAIVGEGGDNET